VFDIGSSLREARMRQELDFAVLEERTKIRPKYLRALEDEQFDILPAPTYVKGFLRSYAEALGLDGQPFVDEYNSRFAVGGDDEIVVRAPRRMPVQQRYNRPVRESRIAVVAVVAITIVTALIIAAWKFGGPEPERVPGLDGTGQTKAAVSPNARIVNLVVRAVAGDSWMEVRPARATRDPLYSGTLEQGQKKTFTGRGLRLALRRPENVLVRVNGNRVELPAGTSFVVTARRIATAPS
jgi:cytoskeleton protein RodZ